MKLVFHAIVPLPYWEWDDKATRMYIRFGHSKLGKWEENCGEFKVTRYVIDNGGVWLDCVFNHFLGKLMIFIAK